MGIASKILTISLALGGVALFSQLPEFAQQYRQRLGGAVDELKLVVSEFDKDAKAATLTRDEAVSQLKNSSERFPRERGETMGQTIDRFVSLSKQQARIENGHKLARPIHVLTAPDRMIVNGAWEIFEPAVPLNMPGAVYGSSGGLLGFLFARLGLGFGRRSKRKKNDAVLQAEISKSQMDEIANAKPVSNLEINKTAGLLESDNPQIDRKDGMLSDVRFRQKVYGEVDENGLVVRSKESKLS